MPDLRDILSADALQKLAAGYDDARFRAANQRAVDAMFPPVRVLTDAVLDGLFPAGGGAALLDARTRELAILVSLATAGAAGSKLAIHVYVALAVGCTVDEIAGAFGVVGAYAGVQKLMDGMGALQLTLTVLAAQVEKGEADLLRVVPALQVAFAGK